jgi:hypothetical protein
MRQGQALARPLVCVTAPARTEGQGAGQGLRRRARPFAARQWRQSAPAHRSKRLTLKAPAS